jgi:hypothetical protein
MIYCEITFICGVPIFVVFMGLIHEIKNPTNNWEAVLDQHAELDFYSARSLKQQSAGRHATPLGHIILIPSQLIFAHTN